MPKPLKIALYAHSTSNNAANYIPIKSYLPILDEGCKNVGYRILTSVEKGDNANERVFL